MRKLLIIPMVVLLSCTKTNVRKEKTHYILKDDFGSIEILTIDSCEYIFGPWGNATVLTHKGNCKFCLNRKNENCKD